MEKGIKINIDSPRVMLSKSESVETDWNVGENEPESEISNSNINFFSSVKAVEEIKRPMTLGIMNKLYR